MWSKGLEIASDSPADEEERDAALDALCLMMYQLNLTMLDWRLSVAFALGAPLISRMPAIQKKWSLEARRRRAEKEETRVEKEVDGRRLTPVPSTGGPS